MEAGTSFVLFLTDLADEMNADRAALRRVGIQRQRSIRSGMEALRIIQDARAPDAPLVLDFIVCAESVSDMSLEDFLRALQDLPGDGPIPPVLCLATDARSASQRQDWGAAVVLSRPYSTKVLAVSLEKIRSAPRVRRKVKAPAAPFYPPPALDKSPEADSHPLLYGRAGLNLLRRGRTEQAREYLLLALKHDPMDSEAALGLAELCRLTGEEELSRRWTHRAGLICLEGGQRDRAELIFSRQPVHWQGDPHFLEARALLEEEDFDGACDLFLRLNDRQEGRPPHAVFSRACQFTSSPDYCMRGLCAALEERGYAGSARKLGRRLLTEEDLDWEGEAADGFWAAFPRLQEVLAVMRFTMNAWRTGEV
ncbi:MAG: hypothetical protein FWG17_02515 [Desulfovibrionaceae bacterium]|nr:hypothetical protein [Desulfovibrionaceae bacterium]